MRNTTPNAVPVTIDAPAATTIAAVSPAVPADRGRIDQLGATGFLLGPGVPDHGQDHRDGDHGVQRPAFQIATAPGLGLNMGPYMAIWAGLAAVAAANSAVDLTVQHAAVDHDIRDAGDVVQVARVAEQFGGDRSAAEVTHRVDGAAVDCLAFTDDRHPMAERLDLGKDVARQQDGGAAVDRFAGALAEYLLHQWVQTGGGFVEEQNPGV